MAAEPALKLSDVTSGYNRQPAIRNIALTADSGEVVGLVGANGAGKTTLMRTILGKVTVHGGQILLNGRDITRLPTNVRVHLGIAYVAQGGHVFPALTVEECLAVAELSNHDPSMRKMMSELFPKIPSLLGQQAGSLSGGERQMLGFCMALIQKPKVLLLDEPSTGLAPNLVAGMMQVISSIAGDLRLTVLLAEQNVKAILPIVTRLLVLRTGELVGQREPSSVLSDEDLRTILL